MVKRMGVYAADWGVDSPQCLEQFGACAAQPDGDRVIWAIGHVLRALWRGQNKLAADWAAPCSPPAIGPPWAGASGALPTC